MPRFIPAYAGNIGFLTFFLPGAAVHPRVCGEHRPRSVRQQVVNGSSPRMRGTCQPLPVSGVARRFIPAYAGNIGCADCWRSTQSVHPRVCGEHWICGPGHCAPAGSSPRMRGTSFCMCSAVIVTRFIPAYAGNMNGRQLAKPVRAVHPRVCGEHYCQSRVSGCSPVHPRVCGEHSGCLWHI